MTTKSKIRSRAWLVASALAVACGALPAHAAQIDIGCSVAELVNAVNAANNAPGSTTISVVPACTMTLTTIDNFWYGPNGLPAITASVTIEGNGLRIVRSSAGAPPFRFFYISGGLSGLDAGNLTLRDMTLSGGIAKGGNSPGAGGGAGLGGALFNQGDVTLSGVTLTDNRAIGGSGTGTSDGSTFQGLGQGGAGMGENNHGNDGGGFGAGFVGTFGGAGGVAPSSGGGAGGGGFVDDGLSTISTTGAAGGGDSGWGGGGHDGGNGGNGGGLGGAGGAFGFGGAHAPGSGNAGGGGGGGGIGGGGGGGCAFGGIGGGGGFGGGGGMGGYMGRGGAGGFGAGGGGGASNTGGAGGFGGGNGGTIANGGGGAGLGGAIFNHNGRVTLVNSTLTGNLAQGGATNAVHDATTGSALGGAIFNLQGTLNVLHSTIALNVLEGANGAQSVDGGGIYNLALLAGDDGGLLPHEASAIVQNSILSNSVYFTSQGLSDLFNLQPPTVGDGAPNIASASVTVGAHNIVMLSGGVTTNASNADPVLAPLANNGGIAPTMALQNGSPAIDRGLGCVTNLPAFDQRGSGYPRIIRSAPDLGAYEYGGSGHGDTIFAYAFEVGC